MLLFNIVLFYIRFLFDVGYTRFMIAFPLLPVGHSFHVGNIGVEMYCLTVMSIVIGTLFTLGSHVMDMRFTLDIQVYASDKVLIGNRKYFPARLCSFLRGLFCYTCILCLMDIRFMIASPLFTYDIHFM